ncbi:riboflavin synthase [Psychrosphaera ytuae]|uniref:Riboflavin synthase n=1 Tax=Psychrosphaera ytuae TaxID=2820710 RepID=A0A975DBS1_9GAMM|nr:riboflavin synthase [Psychrosphaera ytuae]QTH63849.1 riboflavin synthase [Psychrosphaera ytuae]
MFTGIIEATGHLSNITRLGDDYQVEVTSTELDFSDVHLGDSIATNGVCLTVVSFTEQSFKADVSLETINNTGFKHYAAGQTVNLEKAMLPTTRFGGHMVSGHVDAVSHVQSVYDNGRAKDVWISVPAELQKYFVKKGSVTVDGISLTVNDVTDGQIKLTIVPHTFAQTTLAKVRTGDAVNLEVDIIARYVENFVSQNSGSSGVDMSLLARSGYLKK